jgi:membrane peptidoglycan carboxypeptidase
VGTCLAAGGCVSVRPLELVPAARVAQTSLVVDAGGRTVAALHGPEDRTAVPFQGGEPVRLAVVDTEDARFWRHGGVDWLAVARAAARDLERRRVVEGGSTITQQYVKNTYVSGDRTLRRKLAEAGHAWGLEQRNGKLAILEAYLNTVSFGQGAYGVEAAAQAYFSTRADRLTLTQAALLAGMIQAPASQDPFRRPRAARARRAEVLERMEHNGHLPAAARARAAAAPLGLRPGHPGGGGGGGGGSLGRPEVPRAPWFVGWVLDQLLDPADHRFDALGTTRRARTDAVFTGGLRIATTVDLEAQAAAERAVTAVAGRRGGGPYGALVAVEPGTGAFRAMVGGRDWWGDARFGRVNLATGAGGGGRPAGSAFKTFALVAALERGIPPEAVFGAPDGLVVGRRAARTGLAGRQRRGPRVRRGDPAVGDGPVDQHRLRGPAAPPGWRRRRPRGRGGGRGRRTDGGGEPAAGGAELGAGHRRGDAAGDGGGVRDPGRRTCSAR